MIFIEYPRCSTCRKAKKWLDDKKVAYTIRHIVENPPTAEELILWSKKSGLELTKFLNTSGIKYREMGLAKKKNELNAQKLAQLMETDGMLVKRPIFLMDNGLVLVGFKELILGEIIKS